MLDQDGSLETVWVQDGDCNISDFARHVEQKRCPGITRRQPRSPGTYRYMMVVRSTSCF